MPDVALFIPTFSEGGAERVFCRLACGIHRAGRSVDLVLVSARGNYLSDLDPGVNVVNLGRLRARSSCFGMARYLRRARPRIVIAAMEHANVAALIAGKLSRTGIPVITTTHTVLQRESAKDFPFWLRLLVRWCYSFAALRIAVSRDAAAELAQITGLSQDRIRVIHNPVAGSEIIARAQESAGHPWFEDGGPPVILSIGRLRPQKNFAFLLGAFARLRHRADARLVILGEGPERGDLERLATRLGIGADVALPGFVKNPFACLARASVFALSSSWEGFGNVLVEALACGLPIVSTDCPGGPAEILEGGRFGELVPPGAVDLYAEALERALFSTPDRKRLRARAAGFSEDAIVPLYLHAIDDAIAQSGLRLAGMEVDGQLAS
jgi:glycosyltransferase involved in cell wall biosynthesis